MKLGENDPPLEHIQQWGEHVVLREGHQGRLSFGIIIEVGVDWDTVWVPTSVGSVTVNIKRAATSELSKLGAWEYVRKAEMLP